jgi:hypothetical protein
MFVGMREISGSHGCEYEDDSFLGYSGRCVLTPKRRSTSAALHGAVSQKVIFVVVC